MNREQVRKSFWVALAALIAINIYFVRELLAAEILFALVLGVIFCLWFVFFLANEIGERTAGALRRHSGAIQNSAQAVRGGWEDFTRGAARVGRALRDVTDVEGFVGVLAPIRARVARFSQSKRKGLATVLSAISRAALEPARNFVRRAPEQILRGLRFIPPFLSNALLGARRQWAQVEVLARKPFQRSDSQAAN